jgi:predicted permease
MPFLEPERLVYLGRTGQEGIAALRWSYPRFEEMTAINSVFSDMAAFSERTVAVTEDPADQIHVEFVSKNYFRTLGITALRGTVLDGSQQQAIVLSHGLWVARFGTGHGASASTLSVNGIPLQISGVVPGTFRGQSGTVDAWIPAEMLPQISGDAQALSQFSWLFSIVGRLSPSVSESKLSAALALMNARDPNRMTTLGGITPRLMTVHLLDAKVDPRLRQELRLLLGLAVCVLLAAIINVAALLLARAEARRTELSVRVALGAGVRDVLAFFASEAVILVACGGAAGIVLGEWCAAALWTLRPWTPVGSWYRQLSAVGAPGMDWRVFILALLSIAVAGGLCSGVPFVEMWWGKEGSRTRLGSPRFRSVRLLGSRFGLQASLTAVQVSAAVTLLVVSGLFAMNLRRLIRTEPGFRPERLVVFRVSIPKNQYDAPRTAAFFEQLLARLQAMPVVEGVTIDNSVPMSGRTLETAATVGEGLPQGAGGAGTGVEFHTVAPGYLGTLGVPLLRGRDLSVSDATGGPHVVLVNQAMAARYWPGRNPVGERLPSVLFLGMNGTWGPAEVVGVVGDVRYADLARSAMPAIYASYRQAIPSEAYIFVRTKSVSATMAADLRASVREIDGGIPVYELASMRDKMGEATSGPRFALLVSSVFGAVGLLLVAIGLYGLVAFGVNRRTKEIAIRAAIGAQHWQIIVSVASDALHVIGLGVVIGTLLAFLASRLVVHYVYLIGGVSPFAYLGAASVVLLVGGTAIYVPAVRATGIEARTALALE